MTALRGRLTRLERMHATTHGTDREDQRIEVACAQVPSPELRVLLAASDLQAAGQPLTAEMRHVVEQFTTTMETGMWPA